MANRSTPTVTTVQALAVASQFGITLAVSVVLGYLAGHWLDDRLSTGIIFTLIGVLLGLVASVLNTVRLYRGLLGKQGSVRDAQTTASAREANVGNTVDEETHNPD